MMSTFFMGVKGLEGKKLKRCIGNFENVVGNWVREESISRKKLVTLFMDDPVNRVGIS